MRRKNDVLFRVKDREKRKKKKRLEDKGKFLVSETFLTLIKCSKYAIFYSYFTQMENTKEKKMCWCFKDTLRRFNSKINHAVKSAQKPIKN